MTVKTQGGKVITKGGKVSCECCGGEECGSPPPFRCVIPITEEQYKSIRRGGSYSINASFSDEQSIVCSGGQLLGITYDLVVPVNFSSSGEIQSRQCSLIFEGEVRPEFTSVFQVSWHDQPDYSLQINMAYQGNENHPSWADCGDPSFALTVFGIIYLQADESCFGGSFSSSQTPVVKINNETVSSGAFMKWSSSGFILVGSLNFEFNE
jgi:hypothetical protein